MSPFPHDDALFDEAAVSRILRRTAELQQAADRKPTMGLSLEELKELAAEAGLDPDLVTTAVSELQASEDAEATRWWGGPTRFTAEQVVPVSVDDATWERMLDLVRTTYGDPGTVDVRTDAREWGQKTNDGNHTLLTIRSEDRKTRLRILRNAPVLATLLYVLSSILSFIFSLVFFAKSGFPIVLSLPACAAALATVFLLVRWTVARNAAFERRRTAALMSDLTTLALRSASSAPEDGKSRAGETEHALDRPAADGEHLLELPDPPRSETDSGRPAAVKTRL